MMKKILLNNQRGAALVTSLMIMSLLTVLGFSALNNSDIELKISGNERVSAQAFASAEAGVDMAIAWLRGFQLNDTDPNKNQVWKKAYDAYDVKFNMDLMPLDKDNPTGIKEEGFAEGTIGNGDWTYAIFDNSTTDANKAFIASTGRAGSDRSVRNLLVEVAIDKAKSILDYALFAEDDLDLKNKASVYSYNSDKILHLTTDTDASGTYDAETIEADIGSNVQITLGSQTYVAGNIYLGADDSGGDAEFKTKGGGKNIVVLGGNAYTAADGGLALDEDALVGNVDVAELFTDGGLVARSVSWLATEGDTFTHTLDYEGTVTATVITNAADDTTFDVATTGVTYFDDAGDQQLKSGFKIKNIDLKGKDANTPEILTIDNNSDEINLYVYHYTQGQTNYSLELQSATINIETEVIPEKFLDDASKGYVKVEFSDTPILYDSPDANGNLLEKVGDVYYRIDESGVRTDSITDEAGIVTDVPYTGRVFSMLTNTAGNLIIKDGNPVLLDQIFYIKGSDVAYSAIKVVGGGVRIYTTGDVNFGTSTELNNRIYVKENGAIEYLVTATGKEVEGPPTVFSLYSTTTGLINIGTKTAFSGMIYAPYADIVIQNQGDFRGSAIGKTVEMKNTGSVIYDSAMRPKDAERKFVKIDVLSWREL